MRKQLLTLILGFSVLSGCHSKPYVAPPVAPLQANTFKRQWMTPLAMQGGEEATSLFVREKNLYIYSDRHVAYPVDKATGVPALSMPIPERLGTMRPPVDASEKAGARADQTLEVVVVPTDKTLEVFNRKGGYLSSLPLSYAMGSSAVANGSMVYSGANFPDSGRLVAEDLNKPYGGAPRWNVRPENNVAISAAPVVQQGIVYAAFQDGTVMAVSEERADPIWQPLPGMVFSTAASVVADLKADEYGIYVASTDTKLVCLDRANGKVKWQYFAGRALTDAPVATANSVFQVVRGQGIVAIDKMAGEYNRKEKWHVADARQFLSSDDKFAYLTDKNNRIIAVDKQTGQVAFTSKRSDLRIFGTNIKDATIYAATADGRVFAIMPVLKGGQVGELVLEKRPIDAVAVAN